MSSDDLAKLNPSKIYYFEFWSQPRGRWTERENEESLTMNLISWNPRGGGSQQGGSRTDAISLIRLISTDLLRSAPCDVYGRPIIRWRSPVDLSMLPGAANWSPTALPLARR